MELARSAAALKRGVATVRTFGKAVLLVALLGSCDSAALKDVLDTVGSSNSGLTNDTIAAGLKEALTVGTDRVVDNLGVDGGFLNSSRFRIPLPAQLQQAKTAAARVGLDGYFETLEVKMNQAAEAATPKARALFVDAIQALTFADVMGIYRGGDNAATDYLRGRMAAPLKADMRPVVDRSLAEVGAVNAFNQLISRYNALPLVQDIDADLSGHVLDYANEAIFAELADQEAQIRKDPVARSTELLRQVFGAAR